MIYFALQWAEPTVEYKKLYKSFVRTPIKWNEEKQQVDPKATYEDPRKLFPNTYVDYIEILYGKEKKKKSMISYTLFTVYCSKTHHTHKIPFLFC